MIKADLVAAVAAAYALSHAQATRIVQTFLDTLTAGILSGAPVEFRRFGVFAVRKQKPRVITLPSGDKIKLPARKVLTFTPSPTLKKKLNSPNRGVHKPQSPLRP